MYHKKVMDLGIFFSYFCAPNTNILFIDVIILMNINLWKLLTLKWVDLLHVWEPAERDAAGVKTAQVFDKKKMYLEEIVLNFNNHVQSKDREFLYFISAYDKE